MRKKAVILCTILCLLLSACGVAEQQTEPRDISSVLFEREEVQAVFVFVDSFFQPEIDTGTTEDEKRAILDILHGTDLSSFNETKYHAPVGSGIMFKIKTENGEKNVGILSMADGQYLHMQDEETELILCGPADAFDMDELFKLQREISENAEDPNYSGKLEIKWAGIDRNVNKGNTAQVKHILDEALTENDTGQSTEDLTYDIAFEVGESHYGISSDTGFLFREEGSEKKIVKLDSRDLEEVAKFLGIQNIATNTGV